MPRSTFVLITLGLGACASGSPASQTVEAESVGTRVVETREISNAVGSVEMTQDDMDQFVTALPATEQGGECGTMPHEALDPGEHSVQLFFPNQDGAIRNVSLTFASDGTLRHYSDTRGDLRSERVVTGENGDVRILPPQGRQTSIMLNLEQDMGMAMNQGGGEPNEAAAGRASEMLEMANLRLPSQIIATVLSRCGSPVR